MHALPKFSENLASWVDLMVSIGTLLALAGGLAVYAMSSTDRRRAQAESVSAWLVVSSVPGPGAESPREVVAELLIRNGSELPVRQALLWSTKFVGDPYSDEFIPPGETVRSPAVEAMASDTSEHSEELILKFIDAAGRTWIRDGVRLRRGRWWRLDDHGWPKALQNHALQEDPVD